MGAKRSALQPLNPLPRPFQPAILPRSQGQLGKFGVVELSDIAAFCEMPDGKVLSSAETGEMLMWDGGLIKVVLQRPNKRPCHDGPILCMLHDKSSNCIVTGGADGYVRLWQFAKVREERENSARVCKCVHAQNPSTR